MSGFRHISRRRFLKGSLAAGFAIPAIVPAQALGRQGTPPSERVRIGCIGVGNQGMNNLGAFLPDVVAVCDVDQEHLAAAKARVQGNSGRCAVYSDYRKLLESKDVDAVVITTPDHWHCLMTVHACEAGKDVYVEKPLSLTVAEGRVMVNAARRHKRIVQTGSQQRSDARFRQACELVRSGRLGRIRTVRVGIPGVNFKGPAVPDTEPPGSLDYDFWLGPAPKRPYNPLRVHYNFRFFWDYSGGQLTNWGAHHLDIAQWGLGMDSSGPLRIEGTARFHKEGWYEVPESCEVTFRYESGATLVCGDGYRGGATFVGERGAIHVDRGGLEVSPEGLLFQPLGKDDVQLPESANHYQNWLECVRTRRLPIADVEAGHRSATVCHLGNIAIRTGRTITWDPDTEMLNGDPEAAKMLARPYRAPWQHPK